MIISLRDTEIGKSHSGIQRKDNLTQGYRDRITSLRDTEIG